MRLERMREEEEEEEGGRDRRNAGCWVLVAGCWLLGVGCWVLGVPRPGDSLSISRAVSLMEKRPVDLHTELCVLVGRASLSGLNWFVLVCSCSLLLLLLRLALKSPELLGSSQELSTKILVNINR